MTIAHVRNLSQYGVLADVSPYNLPTEAWSLAANARFQNGSILRAPVLRRVPVTLSSADPRFLSNNISLAGFDTVIIGYLNGRVSSYKSGTETNISVSGYVDASAEVPFTTCHLGDVLYINRSDRVPWSMKVTDTQFQNLVNWNATWRAKILRSLNGALCAFGITEGATTYPTKVRTSEFATVNNVPSTWDETVPTNNATANILGEMEGPIMDAQSLGEIMIIYGLNETWTMIPDTSSDVWRYHKLFNDVGAINTNCSVEIDKKHYVFGLTDIWVHDGVSKQSLCDKKTRNFIFRTINLQKTGRCFVCYDRNRKELRFNYVSGDELIAFAGAEGCNRSAVYNLTEGTWTFDDLPFVFGATMSNLDTVVTWTTVVGTWGTIGGSWLDQEDSLKKVLCFVGDVNATYGVLKSLYAVDTQGPGSLIAFDVDTNATKGVTLYKTGIDLDGLPELKDLRGYKVVSSVFPQATFEVSAQPLNFYFGSADNFNQNVVFSDPQTYDGDVENRCDFMSAGRYLFMKITHNDYHAFELTGFDIDLDVYGEQ